MKVLVACEFSGIVRNAFAARGHDAWSCDLLPSDKPLARDYEYAGKTSHTLTSHYQTDVRNIIRSKSAGPWDLMIAHPPCTYLCNSGVRWLHTQSLRRQQMIEAAHFFKALLNAPIDRICVENPIPHKYAVDIIGEKYSQIIQPWQFGHPETKATCLWLKGLPKLKPTNIVSGRNPRVHFASPGPDRWKERSRTLSGIAEAMAQQWTETQ